ncbi:hypothetical protein J437_LFUL008931 [Ladona fulva]|uniref:Uncharacterized protein n=1 Tax=Ladona fulva TaxID=123851 RepID=A0A8K0KBL1_LADFU|nr:hypothetical protein J437_LFUL008931 [Ladona fulva]
MSISRTMAQKDMAELFRSTEEQAEPVPATVKGTFPKWLKGSLVRLGPGKFDLGKSEEFVMNHWFDGYAVLYKFDIQDGEVKFTKKFLQSEAYKKAICVGRPVYTEFATRSYPDPCKNIFSRMMSSLADLSKLIGLNIASSHTVKDERGFSYSLGSSLISGVKHHITKIPPSLVGNAADAWKNAKIIATVPSSSKTSYSYYHSFGMSRNYFVLIEQPMIVNVMKLLAMQVKGKSLRECMEWQPNEMLVVDVNAYESPEIIDKMYLQDLRMSEFTCSHPGGGRRFILPLPKDGDSMAVLQSGSNLVTLEEASAKAFKTGDYITVTCELLSEPGYELPTINRNRFGKKYRYYYAVGLFDQDPYRNSIVKVDTCTGEILVWKENEFQYPGEVQFVPHQNNVGGTVSDELDEDGGILLSCVTDIRKEEPDFLIILDAKDLSEIARAEVMVHVPAAIHGIFI